MKTWLKALGFVSLLGAVVLFGVGCAEVLFGTVYVPVAAVASTKAALDPRRGTDGEIHKAVRTGDTKTVKTLLDAHPRLVQARGDEGKMPLHIASEIGNKDLVLLLLKHNADVNAKDTGYYTSGMHSLWLPTYTATRRTPLFFAVRGGHNDVAELLLTNGSDPAEPLAQLDKGGLICPEPKAMQRLLYKYSTAKKDIFSASKYGDVTSVEAFARQNPTSVNAKDVGGMTPLYLASAQGYEDVAEVLISHGADINAAVAPWNWTPLHVSASHGHKVVVELLVGRGASINARTDDMRTPLHLAIMARHQDTVAFLFAHNAFISTESYPISDQKIANLLMSQPAFKDIRAAISWGTAQQVKAILAAHPELLEAKGASGDTPLHLASAWGHRDIAELLLSLKADVNARSNTGRTPLHGAVYNRHAFVAEVLLSYGADINAKDEFGETPLHLAAQHGVDSMAVLLLSNHADMELKDSRGRTPLHKAIMNLRLKVVELLLDHSANVTAKTGDGETPLRLAKQTGYKEMIQLIQHHGAKD